MSVEIDRPIKEVFDYTIHNVAEWSIIVVKDEVIDEKPEGVGTTFRVTTEEKGRRMEFDGLVTRHEPPTVHAVLSKRYGAFSQFTLFVWPPAIAASHARRRSHVFALNAS